MCVHTCVMLEGQGELSVYVSTCACVCSDVCMVGACEQAPGTVEGLVGPCGWGQ